MNGRNYETHERGHESGMEAPMRRTINPPTRDNYLYPELFLLTHTGVVDASNQYHLHAYEESE